MRENMHRAGYIDYLSEAVAEAGKNIFELPFIWCAPAQRVLKTAVIHDWDIAQRALNDGKGVIFLTPHLGCFEIIAQAISSRVPLTALYRPPKKNALKPLMETAREREQLHLAPANLAARNRAMQ
jgi:KDO2-lipid IV(A) lauroyltransferase